ncbi:hypothetical protein ACVIHI_008613 [Bradyrhizobium sp. USDA 4524]|uniref:hypothetical protein n=1 Tax=unclassified Bradyrhizobium TaxID=2631580 RepID=UPI00209D05DA|nr:MULTISPECIES: hypothetical protein [unclassified Bradyrhizobium]MCP1845924.1 hypothetical protein [Bradyrhizobium sp. USDA 4538]MCP1907442.1 hypothetical protein [Bradyrhizobium sp. USDA 4537]MCP1985228.1 hypothetical protein [Bradyrhizobium sp. USDA 4539]
MLSTIATYQNEATPTVDHRNVDNGQPGDLPALSISDGATARISGYQPDYGAGECKAGQKLGEKINGERHIRSWQATLFEKGGKVHLAPQRVMHVAPT